MTAPQVTSRRYRIVRPARWALGAAAVALVILAGAIGLRRDGGQGAGLAVGVAFVDSLTERAAAARSARDVPFPDAVVLGYVERLRLCLGSPFRLAEYALHDPRLDSTARQRVAWAVVGLTLQGRGYALEPTALAGVEPPVGGDRSEAATRRGSR